MSHPARVVLDEEPIKGSGGDEADGGADDRAHGVDVEGGVEKIRGD